MQQQQCLHEKANNLLQHSREDDANQRSAILVLELPSDVEAKAGVPGGNGQLDVVSVLGASGQGAARVNVSGLASLSFGDGERDGNSGDDSVDDSVDGGGSSGASNLMTMEASVPLGRRQGALVHPLTSTEVTLALDPQSLKGEEALATAKRPRKMAMAEDMISIFVRLFAEWRREAVPM